MLFASFVDREGRAHGIGRARIETGQRKVATSYVIAEGAAAEHGHCASSWDESDAQLMRIPKT